MVLLAEVLAYLQLPGIREPMLSKGCKHGQRLSRHCLAYVGADAKQRVEQGCLVNAGHLICQAPKQQAQHNISPHLCRHVKQRKRPIPDLQQHPTITSLEAFVPELTWQKMPH